MAHQLLEWLHLCCRVPLSWAPQQCPDQLSLGRVVGRVGLVGRRVSPWATTFPSLPAEMLIGLVTKELKSKTGLRVRGGQVC